MTSIAAPIPVATRARKPKLLFALPITAALAIVAALFSKSNFTGHTTSGTGSYFLVSPMELDVKVVKDGELQAVNNIDIACMVEGQTTIQQIVKEGAYVKKGEVLVTLDSAPIKQKIEDQTLEVQKAEADLITAREMKEIQVSQNSSNLDAANVALTLAKLDLQQYEEGAYPQQVYSAETELDMAKITLKNRQEDLA